MLIKVVALSIPSYSMSCFKLPNSLCDDLGNMTPNFGGELTQMRKRSSTGSIWRDYVGPRRMEE